MFNPYPKLNIYCDVAPFAKNAVLLSIEETKNMERLERLNNCSPEVYINASFIKSHF